jgi:hypothetical protein
VTADAMAVHGGGCPLLGARDLSGFVSA